MPTTRGSIAALVLAGSLAGVRADAVTVELVAVRDNTLFQVDLVQNVSSDDAGDYIFAGRDTRS